MNDSFNDMGNALLRMARVISNSDRYRIKIFINFNNRLKKKLTLIMTALLSHY